MRDYQAANELARIANCSAFNVTGASKRQKLNQFSTLYTFPDDSRLQVDHVRGRASAWHMAWTGTAADVALGPVKNVPLKINARGA